jgi:hypothetical protein
MEILIFLKNSLQHTQSIPMKIRNEGFMLIFSLRIIIKPDLRVRGVRINQPILGREGEARRALLAEGATQAPVRAK